MTVYCNEHEFVTDTIMPFLREHWDMLDQLRDGRLTEDELLFSYKQALKEKRPVDAFILNELLMRYEPICRAYEDGYWFRDETILGISEEDISVYEQMVDPNFRSRDGRPRPKHWF